jgi:hypothetical protein
MELIMRNLNEESKIKAFAQYDNYEVEVHFFGQCLEDEKLQNIR